MSNIHLGKFSVMFSSISSVFSLAGIFILCMLLFVSLSHRSPVLFVCLFVLKFPVLSMVDRCVVGVQSWKCFVFSSDLII